MIKSRLAAVLSLGPLLLGALCLGHRASAAVAVVDPEIAAREYGDNPNTIGAQVDPLSPTGLRWVLFADADQAVEASMRTKTRISKGILTKRAWADAQATVFAAYRVGNEGVPLSMFPDSRSGRLTVRLSDPSSKASGLIEQLQQRHPGEIDVQYGLVGSTLAGNRLADPPAGFHRGGAAWDTQSPMSTARGICSTGFRVRANNGVGPQYLVTAAHCVGGPGPGAWSGNNTLGSVQLWKGPGDSDIALIGGINTYSTELYCADDDVTTCNISGANDPAVGVTYCNVGVIARLRCGLRDQTNVGIDCWWGCLGNIAILWRDDAGWGGCVGDSGGALWYPAASGVRGIFHAGEVNNGARFNRQCYTDVHVIRWSTIQARYTVAF